jgi:TRAP-type C4-dicarboxylate transport system, small permease component
MIDRIDIFMRRLAASVAILGGLALIAVVLASVASIVGRALIPLGLSPIQGDFELVELGTGFAIFAFLPWCQITRQHAVVELVSERFSDGANRYIDLVSDLLMLALALLIGWRHYAGMLDKLRYGETTFVLQYPIWWAYAAGLLGAVVFILVSAHCVVLSIRAIATGAKPAAPGGAVH